MQMSYDISLLSGDGRTSKWCFVCG